MPNHAKIAFTDLAIRSLRPGVHFDARTPRFGIRVGKNRRTWIVLQGPRSDKKKLGTYPELSLAEARRRALVAIGSPYQPSTAPTFPEALELFLARSHWRPSSYRQISRTLKKYFHWQKPVDKITHNDVAAVIDDIKAKSEAAHALKDIKAFFNWCIPRYVAHSPCEGLKSPHKYVPRERLLTDKEVVRIWRASLKLGVYGELIRLLICTGQRANQILQLKKEWISDGLITWPAAVMKQNSSHTIPLGKLAAKQLTWEPRPTAYQGKMKAELDRLSHCSGFVLHDFRRYVASTMASLGISLPTVERFIGHRSGSFAGIVSVYQRYNWLPEMREAVDRYERRLVGLLHGQKI
jgi:integrase